MIVKVYSTPTCPWCKKVKAFLKENKVAFKDVDVSSDENEAKKMVDRSGQRSVPVIEINGTTIIGFDEEKLRKELKL